MKNSSTSSLFRSGFLLALVSLFLAITGQAATLTVTNLNDNGSGSLRNAIAIAVSGDTIDLTGVNGTITLTSGELGIDKSLIIQGPGANALTISGNNARRIFNISNSNANVTLSGLTIANGKNNGGVGGGIFNNGTLTVTNSTLSDNSAPFGGFGGGIYNNGALTVTNSTLSGNSGGFGGGGILNYYGTLTLTNCTLSGNGGNTGGGISNYGTATVTNSTLSGNSANGSGGGIYQSSVGTVTVTNSTISGNSGAIGGGIYNQGALTMTNSTLSDNSGAELFGGGILNYGTLTLQNSIVAKSLSGGDLVRYDGTINASNSLIGDDLGAINGTNLSNRTGNPTLGALQNNGGPTQTIALLPGSPALGAGSVALAVDANGNPLTTDQRGTGFARLRNGTVDIGAYQVQLPAAPTFEGGTPAVSVPQNGSLDLTTLNLSPAGGTFSGDGVTGTNGTTFDPSQLAIGVYGITYTITDAYGNNASADFTISVTEKQSLVVTTTSDTSTNVDGQTSLREAIDYVNSGTAGANPKITFAIPTSDPGYDSTTGIYTITLNGTELGISRSVTIQGPGANVLTISGNNASRIFNISNSTSNVTLSGLTIANGNSVSDGGGIYNLGTLTVTNSTLSGNSANDFGGGIYNRSTLTVTNSTLSGNSGGFGGGITNGGTLTVTNSTLSGNSGRTFGGGIINGGSLTVTNSTLSGNSAPSGGGIDNLGTLTVTNSTLSGNSGRTFGGGILNAGSLTVTNSTLSGNSTQFGGGGGIFNDGTTVTLRNSIVLDGISGSITSGSNNITSGTAADAGLDPAGLKNNGGPTQTIALLPGSPALGAGSVALAVDANGNPLTTDQRGTGFARLRNGTVDIGAYQVQLPAAPTFVGGTPAVSVPQNGSLDLTTLNLSPAGGTFSGDGVTGTNGTTFDPSQLAIGVYGITYTITDAYGNKASADFTISVTEKQSLVVTTASDTSTNVDGQISLREAIAYAQFLGGTQTITFANTTANGEAVNFYDGGPHTIILNGTELAINSSVTVQGPGAGVLTIDGNHSSRVFYIGLTNSGPSVVALSALTIANGMTDGLGGGIDIQGILTLTDGVVSGNSALQGGGIFNGGVLILTNSTLSGNFATNAGGGLYSQGYAATVTNSTLSGNSGGFGGGIFNNQGTLTVTDSTVSGNSVNGSGGGIFNKGTLTVTNSTLSGNSAVNNSGGGIANQGTLAVTNSTLSGNSGGNGGGISNSQGSLTVTNSTLSGNSGIYFGGGIYIDGTTTLLNSIVLDGIYGSITSGSNNITSGTAAEAGLEADSNGNPILKNNGGPTQTIALLPGSPAIDAGSGALAVDADGNPLTTDQRGFNRVVNSTVDIGAFEAAYTTVTGPATAPAFGSNVPVTATVANASATGGTVQFVVDGVNYGDPIPVVNGTASASIAGLNAGDYQITALYTNGSGSPEGNANTITQTVVKATAGITFGQLIFTYDGQPKPVTATTSPAGLTVNIVYGNSPTAPTNAGSSPVTATIADANYIGSKTETVTVNKADATISVTGYNVAYTGAAFTATGTATGIGGVPLSGLNLANTTQTNAGNYNDTWTFTDTTGNYQNTTGSVKNVIAKALTLTTLNGPTSVFFTGNPLKPYSATVTGPGGLNEPVVPVDYSNNVNPGQATVTATYPGAANYQASEATATFQILQTVANVALGPLSFTYDGLPKPVTATADLANVAISVTYNGSTTAPTDAGSYAIVATVTTPGYTGSATGTLVIGKASLIVTANNAARFYGAANPAFTASYSGFVNNQTLATSGVTGAPVLTTTATKYSAVGSYPISIAPGNLTATNYTFNLVSGTLKVSLGGIAGLSSASVGSGNTVVDSYNSALGYPASKGSSAVVLSNGTVAIKGAQINGSIVSAGADLNLDNKSLVTGDAVYATSVKNQGTVSGALLKQSSVLFTAPVPPVSSTFTPAPTASNNWISGDFKYDAKKGDLEISGGKTAVLTSGVYYLNGLKLSGGATLKVSGAVVIYLNDKLELSGGSMANTANLPGSLQILSSYTGKDGVKLSGNASVYAAIYAPGTDASLSGNAELFGGLLGKTLDISGNSAVHYDTALPLNWATFPR